MCFEAWLNRTEFSGCVCGGVGIANAYRSSKLGWSKLGHIPVALPLARLLPRDGLGRLLPFSVGSAALHGFALVKRRRVSGQHGSSRPKGFKVRMSADGQTPGNFRGNNIHSCRNTDTRMASYIIHLPRISATLFLMLHRVDFVRLRL